MCLKVVGADVSKAHSGRSQAHDSNLPRASTLQRPVEYRDRWPCGTLLSLAPTIHAVILKRRASSGSEDRVVIGQRYVQVELTAQTRLLYLRGYDLESECPRPIDVPERVRQWPSFLQYRY